MSRFYACIYTNSTPRYLDDEHGPFATREEAVADLVAILEGKSAEWMQAHTEDYIRNNEDQNTEAADELRAGADSACTDDFEYQVAVQ